MKIKIDSIRKEVVIEKLPLKKYIDVLDKIEHLPGQLQKFEGADDQSVLKILPKVIKNSYPDFVEIICIATNLETSEVDELYLHEFIDVVFAIIKENKLAELAQNIKKNLSQAKS